MRTKDFNLKLNDSIRLCGIDGNENYAENSDYKEFYEFLILIDTGVKDENGKIDFLILEVSRHQYNMMFQEFDYSVYQNPNGTTLHQYKDDLDDPNVIKIIEESITELVNQYETQGFDN